MSRIERGEERQVAYAKVLEMFRGMGGHLSKRRVLAAINNLANSDTDWKLERARRGGKPRGLKTLGQSPSPAIQGTPSHDHSH